MDNNTTPVTPADIQALTDEERAQLRKDVSKTIMKNIFKKVALTTTVAVVAHLAMKRIESKADETVENHEIPTES